MDKACKNTKPEPVASSLGNINIRFHELYENRKKAVRKHIDDGRVLICCRTDNRLIVKAGADIQEFTINSSYYHSVKALAHSTLAVFYTLQGSTSDRTLTAVNEWINNIKREGNSTLSNRVVKFTQKFTDSAARNGEVIHASVTEFQRELEPVYAELLMLAAKDEIETLVTTLNTVKGTYSYPSSDIFLVTIGGHQPRYKELSTLIFTRWFEEQFSHIVNTSHHVRYCEGGGGLEDAVNLVISAMTDRQLATSVMGSADALNQDVLGVVAEKAIAKFWPQRKDQES